MSKALRKHKDKAVAHAGKGKWDRALIEYRKAIQLAPNEIVLRQKAAEILTRLNRKAEAVREYQAVAGRYAVDGLLLKAIAISKVILQLDPHHTETQKTLADLYGKQRNNSPITLMSATMAGALAHPRGRAPSKKSVPPLPTAKLRSGAAASNQSEGASIEINALDGVDIDVEEFSMDMGAVDEVLTDADDLIIQEASSIEIQMASGDFPTVPLFSDLSKSAFMTVVDMLDMRMEGPGTTLVKEGSRGQSMFVLVQGQVRVDRELADGKTKTVARMRGGSFFGEMALMSDSPRLASVIAEEECILLELTKANLNKIIKKHPSVEGVLNRFYQNRLLANVLRANPLFRELPAGDKQDLVGQFRSKSVPRGTVFLEQGQKGDGLYLILRGRCEVFASQAGRKRVTFPVMNEGDFFGEISLLKESPVTATVRAKTACVVMRLHRRSFNDFIARHPKMRKAIETLGTERLQRKGKDAENLLV
jgi:CRP-like cAMP-binding protein